jgi:hypothetical protein
VESISGGTSGVFTAAIAAYLNMTIITLDDHFGDWSILPLAAHSGVVRLKVNPTTTTNTLDLLIPFLTGHNERDFKNHLIIVRQTGIRWIKTSE